MRGPDLHSARAEGQRYPGKRIMRHPFPKETIGGSSLKSAKGFSPGASATATIGQIIKDSQHGFAREAESHGSGLLCDVGPPPEPRLASFTRMKDHYPVGQIKSYLPFARLDEQTRSRGTLPGAYTGNLGTR